MCNMITKNDNIEIVINDEADRVMKELFDSLKNRYQNDLGSLKGSQSLFDYVQLLYYKCHKIKSNWGGSYIDSPDWIKNKNATINSINKKDNKCFQYTEAVALDLEEVGKNLVKIAKAKPFINITRKESIFHQKKMIRKKLKRIIEQLLSMFCMLKKKNIYPAYVSKHNLNCKKQAILLMIPCSEKCEAKSEGRWHYLAVKNLRK